MTGDVNDPKGSAVDEREDESREVERAAASQKAARPQEKMTYTTPDGEQVEVPIVRANMPDLFVALRPPRAEPYVMASPKTEAQEIVDFFSARVQQVEELRIDMRKRFAKSDSLKCRYQTGDVAYVLGRPFQLRVYPLGSSKQRPKSGMRGRTTSKFAVDYALSLLTLYVMHPRNYDEARRAFNGYAERVIANNAVNLTRDFVNILMPGKAAPTVRLRAMRDRWSSSEAGALWVSEDIIPYPPDCLVYVLWKELEKRSALSADEIQGHLERVLPGWKRARQILVERAEPYSLQ